MIRYHPSVAITNYVGGQHHEYLAAGAGTAAGPNIGATGHNLTITFLSLGRVALSLRLCESIAQTMPDFAGEVLIVDNGSDAEDLHALRQGLSRHHFRSRIISLSENIGISAGRNLAVKEARTEWILSLDNDVYFLRDPRSFIQRDLAKLGAKFAGLSLLESDRETLYAFGGHLSLDVDAAGRLVLGCFGSVSAQKVGLVDLPCVLGTFLAGGAAVFEKQAFEQLGGYDEAIFVGLEDLEFSVRLFRAGLKLGCFGFTALVHDHANAANEHDRDYERIRFSKAHIRASARYIEDKYGVSIWSEDVSTWLENRAAAQGLAADGAISEVRPISVPARAARPRIALVVDSASWAFSNTARSLHRYLSDEFSFDIVVRSDLDHDEQVLFYAQQHDVVHFFWRGLLKSLIESCAASRTYAGAPVSEIFARAFSSTAITTAVYCHQFLSREDIEAFSKTFESCAGYYVSSNKLFKIYSEAKGMPRPYGVLTDGVDLSLFKPSRRPGLSVQSRKLIIGWSGDSKWDDRDSKGLQSLMVPAIDELRAEGLDVVLKVADRYVAQIPHAQMPAFYNSVDICVCASVAEGTPNPVLEAMACGKPLISTDVGVVPELFGPAQQSFILRERSIAHLKEAIRSLYEDRRRIKELSAENLDSIRPWDWSTRAEGFRSFFREAIGSRMISSLSTAAAE